MVTVETMVEITGETIVEITGETIKMMMTTYLIDSP
jgi:hypothetical protein